MNDGSKNMKAKIKAMECYWRNIKSSKKDERIKQKKMFKLSDDNGEIKRGRHWVNEHIVKLMEQVGG